MPLSRAIAADSSSGVCLSFAFDFAVDLDTILLLDAATGCFSSLALAFAGEFFTVDQGDGKFIQGLEPRSCMPAQPLARSRELTPINLSHRRRSVFMR